MMAQSLAERFRLARESFVLAQELGCTPAEAAKELRRRASVEQCKIVERRLQAKIHAPIARVSRAGHDPEEPRQAWWQRED